MGRTAGQYRIAPHDPARDPALLDLWTRQAGLPPDEARERLVEVLLTATDATGAIAGVTSAYLARSAQLRMVLWHARVFVAAEHRRSDLALRLALAGRDLLRERFASGEDTRGPGLVFEIEHPGLRQRFTEGEWPRTRFAFIGENERGAHVRVHWFPGALAPGAASIAPLPEPPADWTTETLRGRLDERWADRLLRFWAAHGALGEEEGRRRLPEVVSVLLDGDGQVQGVSSVFAADVPLVGGRRFWVFRRFVAPAATDAADLLVGATFAALEEEFEPPAGGPIGLCLLLSPQEAARRPEAEWRDPRLLYAGYLEDGRQVRIGYFAGASIARA